MNMKKKVINLLTLCALCAGASAQTVTVADIEALPGQTVQFAINLSDGKANTYTSLQFNAQFPATGFTPTGNHTLSPLWPTSTAVIGTMDATGLVVIPVGASDPITASEVDNLLTVEFVVDESVPLGSYDITLSNITFGYGFNGKDFAPDVTFSVNVTDALTLDEDNTWGPFATSAACDLLVKRTIKAGEWSTICFPFAMSVDKLKAAFGDDYDLEEFTGYDVEKDGDNKVTGLTLNFTRNTKAAKINTPYVIKTGLDVDVTQFAVNAKVTPGNTRKAIVVEDDDTGEEVEVASMTGTLRAGTVVPMNGLFLSGNKFWYSTGKTQIKAFRAYFELSDVLASVAEANDNVRLSFGDDGTTGVSVEVVREQPTDDTLFDLQGRRVTTPSHGLYVRQGRKVVVK